MARAANVDGSFPSGCESVLELLGWPKGSLQFFSNNHEQPKGTLANPIHRGGEGTTL